MNLALDFGNTRVKVGLFKGSDLDQTFTFATAAELLQSPDLMASVKKCIIASVTNKHNQVLKELSHKFEMLLFTASTPVPITNCYNSVLTLGSDRLAAAVGSHCFYPDQNVLTIDSGTCLKYNFVNSKNEYLGGAISPGIPMRLKAMHHFTHALPLVDLVENYDKLIGQSTGESLLSGSIIGAAGEAEAMIAKYREKYKDLVVVLTGGDAPYLSRQLKNPFFTNPNIILHGLNAILNFNAKK